jgi:phosphatidylserine/phosphatidylglycerophosphate/cardiolipin synthase-like enzyme
MRVSESNDHLRVKAIAGTHVVLMALDMDEETRAGLRGFAIKRGVKGQPQTWLKGIKYFKDLVANPEPKNDYSSRDQPFQSFLWSDYRASPGTEYDFTIVPLYGDLHAFEERHTLTFSVKTEPEFDQEHGVWFNRGAIASHAFETQFHNKSLTDEMVNNVSDDGKLLDDETRWLSRGLAEACLKYINDTNPGEALRVCAYEFTYLPVLRALKRALDRGVDVQIVYHDTKKDDDANRAAIGKAELPEFVTRKGKKNQVLYVRTRTAIPHNKFIVKIVDGTSVQVWTGSTNFTDTGFFGQTNVGHLVTDTDTARTYLKYWTELAKDPPHKQALKTAIELTPNPANALAASSIAAFFSPRTADNMLDWYGQRIVNSATFAMMTIPFNVATPILTALGTTRDAMRLVILEDVPTAEVDDAEKSNRGKLAFSNGAILGKEFIKYKTSGGAQVTPIPNSDLDEWFVEEELARPTNNGHVFFVHSKVLLIDPLSDDPLVCSGSANFSKNSLTANDENMLLIRGDKRVADIYMTELDRIFRHFRSRDIINQEASAGQHNEWLLLDPTDKWIGSNFREGSYKNNRRLLFFPGPGTTKAWSVLAADDPDPFADEDERAAKVRSDRNARARERKAGGAAKGKPKTAPKKKAVTKKKTFSKKAAKISATTATKKKTSKKTAAPKKKKAAKPSSATKKKASNRKKSSRKASKAAARKRPRKAKS